MEKNSGALEEKNTLALLIRQAMTTQNLSLRGLARESGISTTTLSRILHHQQAPTLRQMQLLSEHLSLDMEHLLYAAGIIERKPPSGTDHFWFTVIQDLLSVFQLDLTDVTQNISTTLQVYEQFAQLEEGKQLIHQSFAEKLHATNGAGQVVHYLQELYDGFCDPNTPEARRIAMGSALLYFVQTADAIPDYLFPIGYLDDAIAVQMVMDTIEGL